MTQFDSDANVLTTIATTPEPLAPYGQKVPVSRQDYLAIIGDKLPVNDREKLPPDEREKLSADEVHARMVGWYDLTQLLRTGLEVIISTTLGRHSDRREVEALFTAKASFYDYSCQYMSDLIAEGECRKTDLPRKEIWIDYVSDLGDGWDSTYAVAYYSTRNLSHRQQGQEHTLKRGDLLILGGDEVYPIASKEDYDTRLIQPYATAVPFTDPSQRPHLFAIPGNHDWYDSLTNFSRLFLDEHFLAQKRWRTPQERSYFALKLPHGWWLVGIDVQLNSDIDGAQIEYLKKIAADDVEGMQDGDNIILCCPEPYWIFAEIYSSPDGSEEYDPKYTNNRLSRDYLEEKVFTVRRQDGTEKKMKIALYLAGDLHHYYHIKTYKKTYGEYVHQITAGGGGAFLHPTHGPFEGHYAQLTAEQEAEACANYKHKVQTAAQSKEGAPPREPDLPQPIFKTCFPTKEDSQKLTWLNLLFPFMNRTFGLLTLVIYSLSTWSTLPFIEFHKNEQSRLGVWVRAIVQAVWPFDAQNALGLWLRNLGELVWPLAEFWFLALQKTVRVGMGTPVVVFWVIIIFFGFWLFTDTNSRTYKWKGGFVHGVAHVFAAFVISWLSYGITARLHYTFSIPAWLGLMGGVALLALLLLRLARVRWKRCVGLVGLALLLVSLAAAQWPPHFPSGPTAFSWGWDFKSTPQLFIAALVVCLLSYLIGPLILGGYLYFSLNRNGRHANEAFSGLGIQDWKNFLRLHIDPHGVLRVYPIGIRRIPRNWKKVQYPIRWKDRPDGPERKMNWTTYQPNDKAATPPQLLEPEPIEIGPPASQRKP